MQRLPCTSILQCIAPAVATCRIANRLLLTSEFQYWLMLCKQQLMRIWCICSAQQFSLHAADMLYCSKQPPWKFSLCVLTLCVCSSLHQLLTGVNFVMFAAAFAVPCGPWHGHDNKHSHKRTDADHSPDRPDPQGMRLGLSVQCHPDACLQHLRGSSRRCACLLPFKMQSCCMSC